MKLLADQAIPGIQLFAPYFDCQQLSAEQITADSVRDADILLIRSVTKVNSSLLTGSRVQFVGSCTIGVDHIDLAYLQAKEITFAHAPGCNAVAVSEYVLQTLTRYACERQLRWQDLTVGIIGWGSVGKAVTRLLDSLQIHYRVYDPPLQACHAKTATNLAGKNVSSIAPKKGWASIEEILSCNVITMHVPLTKTTHHLLSLEQLIKIQPYALLINTARGEVLDEAALFAEFAPEHFYMAMDVFAHEPAIDPRWLCYAWQMTPHIAGHSERGKWRGTEMIYDALKQFLQAHNPPLLLSTRADDYAPPMQTVRYDEEAVAPDALSGLLYQVFDLRTTHQQLRQYLARRNPIQENFRAVRRDYVPRREFQDVQLRTNNIVDAQLTALGFVAGTQQGSEK